MRKRILLVMTVVAHALASGACGDDPKRPPVATDDPAAPGVGGVTGGFDGGGQRDGTDGGDAGSCTDLPNTGALTDQQAVIDQLPAGTGGAIADGVYDIIDARVYLGGSGLPGPTGTSYQGSMRVTGAAYERVVLLKSSTGASSETRAAGTLTTSGINGTIALSCPTASQEQVTYTVGVDGVTISNLLTKESFTFRKRL